MHNSNTKGGSGVFSTLIYTEYVWNLVEMSGREAKKIQDGRKEGEVFFFFQLKVDKCVD